MKLNYKYLAIIIIIVISILFFTTLDVKQVDAETSQFSRVQTNIATTSITVMTPGTATTTLNFGDTSDIDEVDMFVQLVASSSATTLNISHQFSNNNIDWYTSTSTNLYGSSLASTTRTVFRRPTHASNFQRAVFTIPIGVGNGIVWSEATLKRNAN